MGRLPHQEHNFQRLKQHLQEVLRESAEDEPLRLALLDVLNNAVATAQLPGERVWEIMVRPHEFAVVRIALELDIPGILSRSNERTAKELAQQTGAEESLIIRVMRSCVALRLFEEVGPRTYRSTSMSSYLAADNQMSNATKFMWDVIGKAVLHLPEYLVQTDHHIPLGRPGVWELTYGKDTDFFSLISKQSKLMQQFHDMMAVQRYRRPDWFDIYPVEEAVIGGFDPSVSDVLLVDIGGSRGHELKKFKERFPHAKGKLVLEDLPEVVDLSPYSETDGITKIGHNFFSGQPIKGARVYYMRSILHDWDDERVREILRNIVPAMTRGYSTLLINDWVIPDTGAALYPCLQDINMLALFSAMERSESHFRELLESVGLQLSNVWGSSTHERCVEAVLRD
ncbi:uncharacterized protein Z519_03623 [Cladophialophora bantiana CBS 173.52]|uniref:O-methyltransferase domain-containing protein n=1 Tax=Cladophialophora bantiana (strain ATCC 10958 / CBS 173.52 / CDC B-1940 / NIH 8579) TaxID=1442370 RepID=A0A0D2G8Z7_CLAB1|nr:uncharacterized protein Z519_03623 [Cladophialophora bantiana CBS 173.52]KIW95042.1 hypothetical protein Z519_03623 [Cladophialophora bantiana CBS 173.52]